MLVTLIILCAYLHAGVGQPSSTQDPNTQMIQNNSLKRLALFVVLDALSHTGFPQLV